MRCFLSRLLTPSTPRLYGLLHAQQRIACLQRCSRRLDMPTYHRIHASMRSYLDNLLRSIRGSSGKVRIDWSGLAPRRFFALKDWLFFITAWPIMLEGLELIAMYLNPIYPKPLLRDMNLNLLDPWAQTCPHLGPATTDFSHDYCYGTNMAHFGGPYSLLWYWTMYALAFGGRFYPLINNLTMIVLVNFLVLWGLRRRFPGFDRRALIVPLYSWASILYMIAWPQMVLSLFAIAASLLLVSKPRISSIFLLLAPLLRFPVGGPSYLWTFILRYSTHVPDNWLPYGLTIVFWLLSLSLLVQRRRSPLRIISMNGR